MTDLVKRLRALARAEHDDLTIGDEAADALEAAERVIRDWVPTFDPTHSNACDCRICRGRDWLARHATEQRPLTIDEERAIRGALRRSTTVVATGQKGGDDDHK
jgi:hypothetical protein